MSRVKRKPVFGVSDTNQAVQPQKMDRGLKIWRDLTFYVAKTKALISCRVICFAPSCSIMKNKQVFSWRGSVVVAAKWTETILDVGLKGVKILMTLLEHNWDTYDLQYMVSLACLRLSCDLYRGENGWWLPVTIVFFFTVRTSLLGEKIQYAQSIQISCYSIYLI